MRRSPLVACVLIGLMPWPAFAQGGPPPGPPQVGGMSLSVTLEGPYRYDDEGVPVDGYIVRPTVGGKPDVSVIPASAIVSFRVCGGRPTLNIPRGSLIKSRCPEAEEQNRLWAKWRLEGGRLVANEAGGQIRTLQVEEFPQAWRSLIWTGEPWIGSGAGEVRALSLPSTSGESLAVIVRPPR